MPGSTCQPPAPIHYLLVELGAGELGRGDVVVVRESGADGAIGGAICVLGWAWHRGWLDAIHAGESKEYDYRIEVVTGRDEIEALRRLNR